MKDPRFIRPARLAEIMDCSKVTIWRMEKRGELPPRKKIGKRCVGWLLSDITDHIKNAPNAADLLDEGE